MKEYLNKLAEEIVESEMTEDIEYDIDMLLDAHNVLLNKESEDYLKEQIKALYEAKFPYGWVKMNEEIINFFAKEIKEELEYEEKDVYEYVDIYEYVDRYFRDNFCHKIADEIEK